MMSSEAIAYVTKLFIVCACAYCHYHAAEAYGGSPIRDLVLTPKQGLQLHGKSIYYEDNGKEFLHNESIRPWERTLKHVTFVTLFTDGNQVATNDSKNQEYLEFLESPYVRQHSNNAVRFGDIVTLATGWLEQIAPNNSYRFHEGRCDHECQEQNHQVRALWQVQKIRHRNNNDRNFRYEMKFSISPVDVDNGPTSTLVKRRTNYNYGGAKQQRHFIQREDDYPQNFGRIIYAEERQFADRHAAEATNMAPQYLHATNNFISNLLPPQPAAAPPSLNIGEYMRRGYVSPDRGFQRVELFPHIMTRMHIPTTYRPTYAQSSLGNGKAPLITHHYHHHFYMPPSGFDNDLQSAEQTTLGGPDGEVSDFLSQRYDEPFQLPLPPAPQKLSTPTPHNYVDIEPQSIVHVTPMPQLYQMHFGSQSPFFPCTLNEQKTLKKEEFVKSEPWLEDPIRYSEPDPLYSTSYEANHSQVEKPNTNRSNSDLEETSSLKDVKVSTEKDFPTTSTTTSTTTLASEDLTTISLTTTTRATASTFQRPTVQISSTTASNFISTSTPATRNALRTVNRYRNNNSRYRATKSTTEKPVLRYQKKRKNNHNTTTTTISTTGIPNDDDVKSGRYKKMLLPTNHKVAENESITTTKQPETTATTTTMPTTTTTTPSTTTNKVATTASTLAQSGNEIYEILTQKSVSKSVSIKVGNNGEEIPVVIDDDDDNDNEVSHKL